MAMTDTTRNPASANAVHGEGNYEAAREYQDAQADFASDKDRVEMAAQEAADALDGPEAEDLERARRESADPGAEQRNSNA
jgi:hypothetical protein